MSEDRMKRMSVSQYKGFIGCEAQQIAKLKGLWDPPRDKTALLVGGYVDAYFEGTLDKFKKANKAIFSKSSRKNFPENPEQWELLKAYQQANDLIKRAESDEMFMHYMRGQKQVREEAVLFKGTLAQSKWLAIMDVVNDDSIVDLKCMANMKRVYKNRRYMSFVEAWGYDYQLAIYQEVHYQKTGIRLPVYICCITKEETPDLAVVEVPQWRLDQCLKDIEENMPRVLAVKDGVVEPVRCEVCDYCKATKKLAEPVDFELAGLSQKEIEELEERSISDEIRRFS